MRETLTISADDVEEAIYEDAAANEPYYIGPKGAIDHAQHWMHAGWNARFDDAGMQPFVAAREIREKIPIGTDGKVDPAGEELEATVRWSDGNPDRDVLQEMRIVIEE